MNAGLRRGAWKAAVVLLTVTKCASAHSGEIRYVGADVLKVRQQPAAGAPTAARLPINARVSLVRRHSGEWCEIAYAKGARPGFADCAFLAEEPLTLEKVDRSIERHTQRVAAARSQSERDGAVTSRFRAEVAHLLSQLERRAALSPSLLTVLSYGHWLEVMLQGPFDQDTDALPEAVPVPTYEAMKRSLSRNFSVGPAWPVDVSQGWYPPAGEGQRPVLAGHGRPSFFAADNEIIGWVGGSHVQRIRRGNKGGVRYGVTFDALGLHALGPLYEMAKQLRRPIKVRFGEPIQDEQAEAQTYYDVGAGLVETQLPVYAITAGGLVQGRLERASYFGGACAEDGGAATAAELVFSAPLKGTIFGIFTSLKPIDLKRAKVALAEGPWIDYHGVLSQRDPDSPSFLATFTVDLDGDGIADLKGGDRKLETTLFSLAPARGSTRLVHASSAVHAPAGAEPAGREPTWLWANIGGTWKEIARYDVDTCA